MTNTETETEGVSPGAGNGAAMIAWLGWTIQKNEMVDATASALRTGTLKVLAAEDDWATTQVDSLDLDQIVSRFRIKHRGDMKDATLNTYEQRFRQTVEMYLKWLGGDPTWKPATRKRAASRTTPVMTDTKPVPPAAATPPTAPKVETPPQSGTITYPFPIRPGMQGKITLPEDLSVREAKRIAAFVATLAFEDEPAAPLAIEAPRLQPGEDRD